LDTDIEGAAVVGIDSLFVLSGSHTEADLMLAGPRQRPTYVAADISGLLAPPAGVGSGHVDQVWRDAHAAWEEADKASETL
jgi:hypothetical protein